MPKIGSKPALQLIRKFAAVPGFPKDVPEAQGVLAETLIRGAICEEHAQDAVNSLLETARRSPTPAELRGWLIQTAMPYKAPAARQCAHCVEGWRRVAYLQTQPAGERAHYKRLTGEQVAQLEGRLGPRQEIIEAVEACSCPAGRLHARAA